MSYINDFPIPSTPEYLAALGEEGFVINGNTLSLSAADGKYLVGNGEYESYKDAIKALTADKLPGDLHIDLYETDGDEKADEVKPWYTEG